MTREVTGNTGASMTVELDGGSPMSSYTVRRADRTSLGTADFVVVSDVREERIFFCTEVYQDVGRRDLVELLVRKALADSIRENVTVVPMCPMFARHLRENGDSFVASGGVFREPVPDDMDVITRAAFGAGVAGVAGVAE
ncbi:N-acetyltransferase [Streptomyces apricus]|uniref:N-acetyltransferase n=1 Tax=Streptomyces apricus TaxID=1828112 RepID=A0A5B0BPF5_9ACTN|nr:N-acetyltransferase [Streptomyces apricus]KAA0943222.1 N-acetyltransferase [Streptomyces apricus]